MTRKRRPSPLLEYVGNKIRLAREEARLSQEQLAILIDVQQATVSRWEAGERDIGILRLGQIAAAVGKDPGYFFDDPVLIDLLAKSHT